MLSSGQLLQRDVDDDWCCVLCTVIKGHNTTDEPIRKLLYFITHSGSLTYKMSSSKMWAIYKWTVAITISLEEAFFPHKTGVESMLSSENFNTIPIFHATKLQRQKYPEAKIYKQDFLFKNNSLNTS